MPQVGGASVRISPDAAGFRDELQAQMDEATAGVTGTVRVDADADEAKAEIQDVKADLDELSAKAATPRVQLNLDEWEDESGIVQAGMEELSAETATPSVSLDQSQVLGIQAQLDDIAGQLEDLTATHAKPTISDEGQIAEMQGALASLQGQLDDIGAKYAEPKVEVSGFARTDAEMDALQSYLDDMSKKIVDPSVVLDAYDAEGQLSDLQAALDYLGSEHVSPAIDLGADADLMQAKLDAIKESLDELGAKSEHPELDIDGWAAAELKLGAMQDQLDEIQARKVAASVTADTADAQSRLSAISAALDYLGSEHVSPSIDMTEETTYVQAQLDAIKASLDELGTKTEHPEVDIQGWAQAETKLAALQAELDDIGHDDEHPKVDIDTGDSFSELFSLKTALVSLVPAAVPVGATLLSSFAGLPAVFNGIGLSALGMVAAVKPAYTALKDYIAANTDTGQSAEQANEQLQTLDAAMAKLSPAAKQAVDVIGGQLYPAFQQMESVLSGDFFGQALSGIKDLVPLFDQLRPSIEADVSGFGDFISQMGKWSTSAQGMHDWVTISQEGTVVMQTLGQALEDVIKGFGSLGAQAMPIVKDIGQSIDDVAQKFEEWSQAGQGSTKFLDYVEENLPKVKAFIDQLADTVENLLKDWSGLGGSMLSGVDLLLKLADAAAKASPLLGDLAVEGYGLVKVIGAVGPAIKVVSAAMDSEIVAKVGQWVAGLGATAAGWLGIGEAADDAEGETVAAASGIDIALGATGIGLVIVGLGAAITLMATHWDESLHDIMAWTGDAANFIIQHSNLIAGALVYLLGPLGVVLAAVEELATHWESAWTDMESITKTGGDDIVTVAEGVGQDLENAFDTALNDVAKAFEELANSAIQALNSIIGSLNSMMDSLKDAGSLLGKVLGHGVGKDINGAVPTIPQISGGVGTGGLGLSQPGWASFSGVSTPTGLTWNADSALNLGHMFEGSGTKLSALTSDTTKLPSFGPYPTTTGTSGGGASPSLPAPYAASVPGAATGTSPSSASTSASDAAEKAAETAQTLENSVNSLLQSFSSLVAPQQNAVAEQKASIAGLMPQMNSLISQIVATHSAALEKLVPELVAAHKAALAQLVNLEQIQALNVQGTAATDAASALSTHLGDLANLATAQMALNGPGGGTTADQAQVALDKIQASTDAEVAKLQAISDRLNITEPGTVGAQKAATNLADAQARQKDAVAAAQATLTAAQAQQEASQALVQAAQQQISDRAEAKATSISDAAAIATVQGPGGDTQANQLAVVAARVQQATDAQIAKLQAVLDELQATHGTQHEINAAQTALTQADGRQKVEVAAAQAQQQAAATQEQAAQTLLQAVNQQISDRAQAKATQMSDATAIASAIATEQGPGGGTRADQLAVVVARVQAQTDAQVAKLQGVLDRLQATPGTSQGQINAANTAVTEAKARQQVEVQAAQDQLTAAQQHLQAAQAFAQAVDQQVADAAQARAQEMADRAELSIDLKTLNGPGGGTAAQQAQVALDRITISMQTMVDKAQAAVDEATKSGSGPALTAANAQLADAKARQQVAVQAAQDQLNAAQASLQASDAFRQATQTFETDTANAWAKVQSDLSTEMTDRAQSAATIKGDMTTAAQNVAQAAATVQSDMTTAANDLVAAASQLAQDAAQIQSDALNAQSTAISDQSKIQQDQTSNLVDSINDQSQTLVDQMAEQGLYGVALQEQQAQVALDQLKQQEDANIGQAQLHADQVKASDDAAEAAAQAHLDQVTAQQQAIVSAAQANLDTVTLQEAQLVATAQAHADQVTTAQAQKVATAQAHVDAVTAQQQERVDTAQLALDLANISKNQAAINQATANLTAATNQQTTAVQQAQDQYQAAVNTQTTQTAQANAQLVAAQNQQTTAVQQAQDAYSSAQAQQQSVVSAAQDALTTIQSQAQVNEALANQALTQAQDAAAVAEAQQQAVIAQLQEQTNLLGELGSGGIHITLTDTGDPFQNAAAIAWELRMAGLGS